MKLSLSDVKNITLGAISVIEEEGGIAFKRFEGAPLDHYGKSGRSSASVLLDFYTDATKISIDYRISRVGRAFGFFDLYEEDTLTYHFGKEVSEEEGFYLGHFEAPLSSGEKRVRLYMPNLFETNIINLELNDGASLRASEHGKSLLMMGDSITHGYDALFPSLSYANIVAREFNFEMINQAIGGEMFKTVSLPEVSTLTPDYITVAYGTNDWSWSEKTLEQCVENAHAYFKKLRGLYPTSRVFYISPLYRGDEGRITTLGDFFGAVEAFAAVAREYGAEVICGRELIPHSSLMFDDKYLHPNDLGFTQYASMLIKRLKALGVQ